jgi:Ser/Thr protein kinase RdoA (MazF antagonist)
MTEFFYRLTPDWVLHAVETGGFLPTGHCTALNSLENRVYDLRLEDESHVVAKFYRPGRWSIEAIREEHQFLFDLREAEIPVCAPLRFSDGSSVKEVEGIYYALWPRTGGRAPEELADGQLEVLGRLLARIHNVGDSAEAPARRMLTGESIGLAALDLLEDNNFLPPSCANRFAEVVEEVAEIYDERSAQVPYLRIHGDCHMGNLLQGPEGWFFLDFDDFLTGPAVHDVWMLLPGQDFESKRQRSVLMEAYRQFRGFENSWFGLVEPLRALRFVFYAGWIAKRWEDPAFPRAFPHFGTDQYWENETRDLELQLERIRSEEGEFARLGP